MARRTHRGNPDNYFLGLRDRKLVRVQCSVKGSAYQVCEGDRPGDLHPLQQVGLG